MTTKAVKAIQCTEITFVTGYNRERADLRAGGSPIFGPFAFVPQGEEEAFIETVLSHLEETGKRDRIREVRQVNAGLKEVGSTATVEWMCSYLDDENNW